MSNNILFVFEGAKTEKTIFDSLTKYFVNENTIVTCVYCTTIYKMYVEISEDEDLDTYNLLKDIEINKNVLNGFKRSDFAEIYMFFDYDGHATNADDNKLRLLLAFFNEETDKGKLYLSYPMVEALKHIENQDTFKELKIKCKVNTDYKNMVSRSSISKFLHFKRYDFKIWTEVIIFHLKKMNLIVNETYEFPERTENQTIIFQKQLEKYIDIDETVAVLSAFPVFLHDYYGNNTLKNKLFV